MRLVPCDIYQSVYSKTLGKVFKVGETGAFVPEHEAILWERKEYLLICEGTDYAEDNAEQGRGEIPERGRDTDPDGNDGAGPEAEGGMAAGSAAADASGPVKRKRTRRGAKGSGERDAPDRDAGDWLGVDTKGTDSD